MIGLGIDLVDITRFEIALQKGDFLERCFALAEIARYHEIRKITYLAGRFAVKEAVVKALGTGLIDGLSLSDIEVAQLPSGAPDIRLTGLAATIAQELRIKKWLVSISHTQLHATAVVMAE
jgi:holo-[acyl-carrier protein] synthase